MKDSARDYHKFCVETASISAALSSAWMIAAKYRKHTMSALQAYHSDIHREEKRKMRRRRRKIKKTMATNQNDDDDDELYDDDDGDRDDES